MSYEGFEQVLCKNGHLREFDCWSTVELFDPANVCPVCKEVWVYRNMVDETNGIIEDEPGTMRRKFEVEEYSTSVMCNYGCLHTVKEARYKIPERT